MTLHHSAEHPPSNGACSRHMKTRSKRGHRRSAFRIYSAGKQASDHRLALQSNETARLNDDTNTISPEDVATSSEWASMNFHLPVVSTGSTHKHSPSSWQSIGWTRGACSNDVRTRSTKSTQNSRSSSLLDAQLRQVSFSTATCFAK